MHFRFKNPTFLAAPPATKSVRRTCMRRVGTGLLALLLLIPCAVQAGGSAPEAVFLPDYPKGVAYEDTAGRLAQKIANEIPMELRIGLCTFAGDTAAALLGQTEGNFCYSPQSLYCALLLAAGGAGGSTRAEVYEALGLTELAAQGATPEDLAGMAGTLQRRVHLDDEKRALKIAHSVWLQKEYGYQPEFLEIARLQYGELYSADFTDPSTGKAMGNWVAEQTRGLLTPDIQTVDAKQSLAICNTVYLKAPWVEAFGWTRSQPFYPQDGTEADCVFMGHTFEDVEYGAGNGYQRVTVRLDGDIQMTLVLPEEGVEPGSLLATPEKALPLLLTGSGYPRKVHVELPRFACDTSIDLKEMLFAIGIVSAFDSRRADFSALTDVPLFLTEARQDIRIEVDEDGIEAAAFTELDAIAMGMPGQKEEEPIRMIFDRPFIYCVAVEGIPLFVGVVMDPGE